uniref:F-box domain-containing protein n=1 Tax=Strongyloides papillosus TaxID=174720 RepID=A0A0N5CFD0_STREA
MDGKKEISFEDLMKVDYVRRHILKYVMKFSDIESLAKASQRLGFLISGDRIKRDGMWIRDFPSLTVKCEQDLKRLHEIPILKRINIVKDNRFCNEVEEGSRYYGETIIGRNQTWFNIKLDIGRYIPEERVPLIQKIAGEFMLNHQLRNGVETLDFNSKCNREQRSLLIECLTFMSHENVKRIELPGSILKNCQCLRDPNVWTRDMFDGFPKLNEVIFCLPEKRDSYYYGSFGNGSTIKYIIKSLVKKRNGTIVFSDVRPEDDGLIRNVEKIYGYCGRHGIKIKLTSGTEIFGNIERFVTTASRGNVRFSVDNLITRHSLSINHSTPFLKIIEIFSFYENLEELWINLVDLKIINDDIKDTCLTNLGKYSLRNCRKLKKLELQYFKDDGEHSEYTEEMLENNLIFIASLMPDTVERLKITRNFNLSSRVTDKLNEYMPNIRMLTFYNGELKDDDCLSAFKNLEIFLTWGSPSIEIPRTIQLFFIHQSYPDIHGYENADKEIFGKYSKRFLKYLKIGKENYVFLNDITRWSEYKRVVQEGFY